MSPLLLGTKQGVHSRFYFHGQVFGLEQPDGRVVRGTIYDHQALCDVTNDLVKRKQLIGRLGKVDYFRRKR